MSDEMSHRWQAIAVIVAAIIGAAAVILAAYIQRPVTTNASKTPVDAEREASTEHAGHTSAPPTATTSNTTAPAPARTVAVPYDSAGLESREASIQKVLRRIFGDDASTDRVYPSVPAGGTQPEEIQRFVPSYPIAARQARVEGHAVIRGIVRRDGSITSLQIIQDPGSGLGEAALRAVKQWRFRPATYRGDAIDVYYTVTVNFRLPGER